MIPKIGVPRLYPGNEIPILYPGERATCAAIPFDRLVEAIDHAAERGCDSLTIRPRQWIVTPEPGWRGAYRRWRYRIIGRWLSKLGWGQPHLVTRVTRRSTHESSE